MVGEELATGEARWPLGGEAPDCEFPGHLVAPADGRIEVTEQEATAFAPAHLAVDVYTRLGTLEVRRVFRLYENCPAVGCDVFLRGRTAQPWGAQATDTAGLGNIESAAAMREGRVAATIVHRIWAPHRHLDVECVQFFDVTDRNNNLVFPRRVQPYRQPLQLQGNLLLCRDRLADRSLFLLKEAPCSDVQLAWPGFDFVVRQNELQVTGVGLRSDDIREDEWVRGYGFALGVAVKDELALLSALRRYQMCRRLRRPDRDEMIMLNTWGDRGQGDRVNEEGILREIEAGARLGVTHLQLDHGWESTQDPANVWPLNLKNIWDTPHFWDVNPVRFPRGLQPCVDAAREAGLELCLWFNPSIEDDFAHWRDDADVLIGLHRAHGIRTFKIDGVQLPTKQAELNFRRFLEAVREATGGEAVFNLDITAGRRFGYHYFNEYGNFFLENRYTDWTNYYPHWTLRNLWQLSRYVPPQSLQLEFLNRWRNPENYPPDDPLAPCRVPFDYCFAVAMPAQPLAWFEAANLPQEAFALGELIRVYRRHMAAMHAGVILPVGEEPSGVGWTGFQSLTGDDRGYLLVFREWNQRAEARICCRGLAGREVRATPLAGAGAAVASRADDDGGLRFSLPEPFSFGLYAYTVEG